MPTAKDITALRKNGQLAEAFELATELLIAEPDNLWTKRAMGWVRFERLRALAKSNASEEFIQEWVALSALVADRPAEETMLTNQAVWQAVSHLFALGNSNKAHDVLTTVFASIQHWSFERPSDLYSALLRAFLKVGKMWSGLYEFLTWWQLSNLRPEDYLPGITNEGKKMMSMAEEAMTALLPFARRKQSEFWLWDLLADLYDDEPEKAIACLCRAVSCRTQEKFLVNARLNLAVKLKQAGKISEALTELTQSIKARQDEGWSVAPDYAGAADKLMMKGGVVLANNKALYRHYRPFTDELLYVDVPEKVGVVTSLNSDKKVAQFSVDHTVAGHFKYEGRMERVKPGDFVALRLEERSGKDGPFWVPLSVKPTDVMPSSELFKRFSGTVERVTGKEFSFIEHVFISPSLLNGIQDGSSVTGSALWLFDRNKNKYGWKAISLSRAT